MTDLDRRSIITSLLASLGLTAALPAERLLAWAQSSSSPRPHRIDIHHHFAPPAWVTEVKGRPLLQAGEHHVDAGKVDRRHGSRRRGGGDGVDHQSRSVVWRRRR